jgi:hypothetical protein
MSLESAIAELNANIVKLIAVLSDPTKPIKPAASKPAEASPPASPKAETPPASPAAPKAETPPAVTYDAVKAALLGLGAVKGRDSITAVLKTFGVANGPALKPEQYADVLAAIDAAKAA